MNLSQREKSVLAVGAVVVISIVVFQFFIKPRIGRVKTLRRVISDKRQMLGELRAKSEQYNSIAEELEKMRLKMGGQPQERKILSFVERAQKDIGLMPKVAYMKPSTVSVNDLYEEVIIDIKLQSISLGQLIQFILELESSEFMIGFKSLDIRRRPQGSNLLEATMQLVSLLSIDSG
jgi:type II secretory pathway component PulM